MDVQDNDLRKEKEMVYKHDRATDAGSLTTFIVKGKDTATFSIVSFVMSDSFVEKNHIARADRSIEIKAFYPETLEWKVIVPAGVFSYGDCIKMQDDGCKTLLDKVQAFLRDYFGIDFKW